MMKLKAQIKSHSGSIYLFPIALLLNSSAMTILLIGVGFSGNVELAADIGIVHGATLACFYVFSANARNIILSDASADTWPLILRSRLYLVVPLGGLSFAASLFIADIHWSLVLALVLRRCFEWLTEIYLSQIERERNLDAVITFIGVQGVLLAMVFIWITLDVTSPAFGIVVWAIVPVILIVGFLAKNLRRKVWIERGWVALVPHFGSTAVIGITVFLFRLFILLLVGKQLAGGLYTAFAAGGILGSVFAQALGPTLEFQKDPDKGDRPPMWLTILTIGNAVVGAAMLVLAVKASDSVTLFGQSTIFWTAVGASLIGASVMVFAQRSRLRILQRHTDVDVFGPDLLTNVLIVGCVPYGFYLLGPQSLAYLFLLNAIFAFVFYSSAERITAAGETFSAGSMTWIRYAIAFVIAFPLFFQLSGQVFDDPRFLFTSEGILLMLPIPFSVFACYGSIVLLANYRNTHAGLWMIFASFCLMTLSTVITTHGESSANQAKLILLIQFILPMFALVSGQMFEADKKGGCRFQKPFLIAVTFIVITQLICGWFQERVILTPFLYIFSIYQHLQYVPLIMICAYLVALFALWELSRYRILLLCMAGPIGVYAMASTSILTLMALVLGTGVFLIHMWRSGGNRKLICVLVLLVLGGGAAYLPVIKDHGNYVDKVSGFLEPKQGEGSREIPANVSDRVKTWRYYIEGIGSDRWRLLWGHAKPPDRQAFPSAHNYYLDLAYNFGVVALLPMLILVYATVLKVCRNPLAILTSANTFGLVFVVFFLLMVDNSLKVGLRQPYPGIFTFFLWGVLLTRLNIGREDSLGRSSNTHVERRVRDTA